MLIKSILNSYNFFILQYIFLLINFHVANVRLCQQSSKIIIFGHHGFKTCFVLKQKYSVCPVFELFFYCIAVTILIPSTPKCSASRGCNHLIDNIEKVTRHQCTPAYITENRCKPYLNKCNTAHTTMILMRCRIMCDKVENLEKRQLMKIRQARII